MMNKKLIKHKKKKMLSNAIKNLKEAKYNIIMILANESVSNNPIRKDNIIQTIKNKISFYEDSLKDNYYDEIFSYEELYVIKYDTAEILNLSAKIYKSEINWFRFGTWDYLYDMIIIGRNSEDYIKKYQELVKEKKKTPSLTNIIVKFIALIILFCCGISLFIYWG